MQDNESIVIFRRTNTAYFRSLSIFVDGKKIGKVKENKNIKLPIEKGRHEIYVKMDWVKSNRVSFELSPGKPTRFVAITPLAGWRTILAFLYLFTWNKLFVLRILQENENPNEAKIKLTWVDHTISVGFFALILYLVYLFYCLTKCV